MGYSPCSGRSGGAVYPAEVRSRVSFVRMSPHRRMIIRISRHLSCILHVIIATIQPYRISEIRAITTTANTPAHSHINHHATARLKPLFITVIQYIMNRLVVSEYDGSTAYALSAWIPCFSASAFV